MSELEALPEGWLYTTLGEICEPSQYGYTAKAGTEGNYQFLRTTDITKPFLDWDNVPFCTLPDSEAEKYLLKDGDIVISRAGSIGYSSLIQSPRKSVFASYLIRFRPLIDNKYLNYFLATPVYWQSISEGSSGIAVQNVNAKTLSAIRLPLAPENEQTRIVDKLEELLSDLDNGVAELKAAQTKLTQYRQSLLKSAVEGSLTAEWRKQNPAKETGEQLLQRILTERRQRWEQQKLVEFEEKGKTPPKDWQKKYPEPVKPDVSELPELPDGWVWASLSTIAEQIQIGPFGSLLHKHDYISNGIPLINPTHIKDQKIEPNFNFSVGPKKMKELQNFVMKTNDIVIGRRGEMGRCAVITDVENGWLCGTGSLFIRLANGMNSFFYSWILSSRRVRDFLSEFSVGTTMQNLNQKILHSIPVPLCSNIEQFEISNQLALEYQRIDKQLIELTSAFHSIEAQRKNILKDAFSGKLVKQDPSDEPASVLLDKIKAERAAQAKFPKPKRTKKKANNKASIMDTLFEVLQAKGDWMDAQEAFRACGVTDGGDFSDIVDKVESLYAELRKLEKEEKLIEIRRVGNYDQLKLRNGNAS